MSDSQVAGGFWCQLPKRFVREAFPRLRDKYTLALECGAHEWEVVLLPRPGDGAGLSGNWRGFAIDNLIFPSDAVVFEVLHARRVRAHLFRAWDYAAAPPEGVPHAVGGAPSGAMPGAGDFAFCVGELGDSGIPLGAAGDAAQAASGSDGGGDGAAAPPPPPRTFAVLKTGGRKVAAAAGRGAAVQGGEGAPVTPPVRGAKAAAVKRKAFRRAARRGGRGAAEDSEATDSCCSSDGGGGSSEATDDEASCDSDAPAAKRARGAVAPPGVAAARRAPKRQPPKTKPQQTQRNKKPAAAPPAAEESGGGDEGAEEEYDVAMIIGTRVTADGERLFKVRWLGYGEADDTYEPRSSLAQHPASYRWASAVPADLAAEYAAL